MQKNWQSAIEGKKIGLFGLGKSNLSILSLLPEWVEVILRSEKELAALPETKAKIVAVYEKENAFLNPQEDILILSPSVRRDRKELIPFRKYGVVFTSDHELFFDNVDSVVFAVSGSDGKSTTATIASLLVSEKFGRISPIGNIGKPMLKALLTAPSSAYVCELSSFMLTYGKYRVFRGAITNISENHLDWHCSFEEYLDVKLSLLGRAFEAVVNADDKISFKYAKNRSPYAVFSQSLPYKRLKRELHAAVFYTLEEGFIRRNGEKILDLQKIKKNEKYNINNFLCALALTDGYASRSRIEEVAEGFTGLAHRAETVYSENGIDYIDSSIDSTPQRTKNTLSAISRRVVILLGGRGKGLSYEPLVEPLKKYAKCAVIYGENRKEIKETLGKDVLFYEKDSFNDACRFACTLLSSGDALLLSPASTSYDEFSSFEERGEKFKEIIKEICGKNREQDK